MGPMISKAAKERAERLIQESQDAGADVLLDGRCVVGPTRCLFFVQRKFSLLDCLFTLIYTKR